MSGSDGQPLDSPPSGSPAEVRGEWRALLERRRTEVEVALGAARADARPVQLDLSIGRLSRMDALQQQHLAQARVRGLETQLAQIARALAKLGDGRYGECAACEEPIALARLRVRPEALLCVRCEGGSAR